MLTTSILKTSELANQKRKMATMDVSVSPTSPASESSNGERSPRKRARVQFHSDVDVRRIADHPEQKSAAVVREEVRRAIHRHVSAADSEAYEGIKGLFSADHRRAGHDDDDDNEEDIPSSTILKYHIMGLLSNIALLDRSCSGLVHALLNSEWLGRDESYVKLFIRFLGNLAAAHGTYLGAVLRMLVNHLSQVSSATGSLPGHERVQVSELYSRTHMGLRYVLHLIPAGSGALAPVLATQFPFETDSAKANVAYTRNLIRVISYAPELQADILALIMEKLVKIDVQIQVDMDDFEDEAGEDLVHGMSMDVDDNQSDNSADDDDEEDDELINMEEKRAGIIKDNIYKLDGMIDVMFEYYAPPFTSGSEDKKEDTLDILLDHFQSIILPTYRSRHAQFLLFHFSQSSPELVDRFATICMQFILNKRLSGIVRQSAAAYLASFVARGAHVSGEVARDIFDLLGTHMNNMLDDYEPTCRGPDLRRYGPFYSTVQALLYIFCFRWRDLTTVGYDAAASLSVDDIDPDNTVFPQKIKEAFHNAIYSKLNPLKVCSQAIVMEFARIAHHLRLLYVFPLLETNKRLRISSFHISNNSAMLSTTPTTEMAEREIRAGDEAGYQLDAYFPFDPYQLPRSRRWLEGDYVEWRGVPGMQVEGEESDDEEDEEEEEE